MTLNFNYNQREYSIEIIPDEDDWWTSYNEFDIHYCKDYNEVCVYLTNNYLTTIYKQTIL